MKIRDNQLNSDGEQNYTKKLPHNIDSPFSHLAGDEVKVV